MPQSQHLIDDPHLPLVFGRYLLLERLSRGGMGEIFIAKHGLVGFEKLCVIKKVLPNLAENDQFISRFIDEANVAIKLQHANIAQVFEVGRVGSEYFLAIEFVEGRDLRRIQSVLAERGLRFPHDVVLHLVRELANGLAYAHRRSDDRGASLELVHCDISPPNIMVSFEGETKIIDFGIAKSTARATETDPSMGFGKFGYMAPEQLIRGGKIDHRTDIYAAGVVLFELLTGRRLYAAAEVPDYRALARKVARGEHDKPSAVDPSLAPYDHLVERCLAARPEDRFQLGAELRDALQRTLVGINPTMNADRLGEYMRELFADELSSAQAVSARMRATALADYEKELTTQGAEAVSYAMANLPLLAPPTEAVPRQPSSVRAADRFGPQRAVGRGRWIRAAAIALGVGAAGTAAALYFRSAGDRPSRAAAAPPMAETVPSASRVGGSGAITPTVEALDLAEAGPGLEHEEPAQPAPSPGARAEDGAPPSPAATGEGRGQGRGDSPAPREPATRSDAKKRERARAPAPSAPSAAAVHAKFREISKEYRAFQAKYGGRLEAAWTEIATSAQYAKDATALSNLDAKLDRFRRRMNAVE